MKIYDITQELFSCAVYPGDTVPRRQTVKSIAQGDLYNLTDLTLCAHNGTHIDAPFHFLKEGRTAEQLQLSKTLGVSFVADFSGELGAEDAEYLLKKARKKHPRGWKKLLLRGDAVVTAPAARVFAEAGVELIGVESQSVGEEQAPMEVHVILLSHEVVLLEGLRLGGVPEGVYFLSALPLALGGCDGAPCRAVLAELEAEEMPLC